MIKMSTDYESMFKKISRMLGKEEKEKEKQDSMEKAKKEEIKKTIKSAYKTGGWEHQHHYDPSIGGDEAQKERDFSGYLAAADGMKKELLKDPKKYDNWDFQRKCEKIVRIYTNAAKDCAVDDPEKLKMAEKRLSRFGTELTKYAEKIKQKDEKYAPCLEKAEEALKEGYKIKEHIKDSTSILRAAKKYILNK